MPSYDFNKQGGIIVQSKKMLKLEGKASPNIADALCLTEYFSATAYKVFKPKETKRSRNERLSYRKASPHMWMAC